MFELTMDGRVVKRGHISDCLSFALGVNPRSRLSLDEVEVFEDDGLLETLMMEEVQQ